VKRFACFVLALAACGDDGTAPIDGPSIDRPPPSLGGTFFVIQTRSQQQDSTAIVGLFGEGVRNTTTTREDGPCRIERSTPLNADLHDAGQLRITASGASSSIVTLPAGAGYQDAIGSYRYLGGENLLVETMGATVPAFSQAIAFPHPVTVMTTPTQISKGVELTATWTPTPSDVLIQISQGSPTSLQVTCTFAGSSGSGTVPASAFADASA
jgi:hypothetical protein